MSTQSREDSLNAHILAFAAATGSAAFASGFLLGPDLIEQPEDAVVLVAAVAALVAGAWWVANVIVWALALRGGRTLGRFTLPGSKRMAQLLLALSLSSSCVAEASEGPAMVLVETAAVTTEMSAPSPSSTAPPTNSTAAHSALDNTALDGTGPTTSTTDGDERLEADADDASIAEADIDETTVDTPPEGSTPDPISGDSASIPEHDVIVVAGDNLWTITADALEHHGVDSPDSATIAAYWRLVVAGNEVRSGKPDLIVPGETIRLPAYELTGDPST